MKTCNSSLVVVLVVVLFSLEALACNDARDCAACTKLPRMVTAIENRDKIVEFLGRKLCEQWKELKFKAVVIQSDSLTSCMTFDGTPYSEEEISTCSMVEEIEFRLDDDLAAQVTNPVTKWMAQDGQFECEPDGTMVFNRGRTQHSQLDSLFQPTPFLPFASDWPEASMTVGFEVFAPAELEEEHCGDGCTLYCYDAMSAFISISDIVDQTGASVLPDPQN